MPFRHAIFFKCLSSWARNRILQLLAERGEIQVEELASLLKLKGPTVSRHLQLLRMHDLVTVRREGQVRFYSINKDEISQRIAAYLCWLGIDVVTIPSQSSAHQSPIASHGSFPAAHSGPREEKPQYGSSFNASEADE